MAKKVRIGDLFVIPLTDGNLALGKVLWRGKTSSFRNSLQIGIYKRIAKAEVEDATLRGLKPRTLLYVIASAFERPSRPGWRVIGNERLEPHERGMTRRIYSVFVYFEDKCLGLATEKDCRKLPAGGAQLPCPTEAEINRTFGLEPDPHTNPRPDNKPNELDASAFPWSEAIEWAAALGRSANFAPVKGALSAVVKAKYAEMDECHEAVAAAEVVSAAKGHPAKNLPEEVKQWVAKHQSKFDSSLVDLAIRAVERVRTDSELQQEWDESTSLNDWKKHVTGLVKRLKA